MKKIPEDPDLIIQAALLHDTIEDTETTEEELTAVFGEDVKAVVMALTKAEDDNMGKTEKMNDSLDRIVSVGKPAAIVKLCDRITNMQPPPEDWDSRKRSEYLKEAELIHSRLAGFHEYLGKRLKNCMIQYKSYI